MNPLLQSVILALQSGDQKEAIAEIDRVTEFCVKNEDEKVLTVMPGAMCARRTDPTYPEVSTVPPSPMRIRGMSDPVPDT
jgi:hypothetical protein